MSVPDHSGHQVREGMPLKSRAGLVLTGFLIIAGALLFTEHRALVLLVWLPLLACPFMHVFMHSGQSHHGSQDKLGDEKETP